MLFQVVENSHGIETPLMDQKKKINYNKETASRSKHFKKVLKRNEKIIDDGLLRRKRTPDELNDENGEVYLLNGKFFKYP